MTIAPLKFIVDEITSSALNVSILVPAGASPETYEPTPQQIISLSDSKMIFSTGLIDFERQLANKLSTNAGNQVIDLSEGIDVVEGSCAHHEHNGHGVDPHIWTSPKLIKKMAQTAYNQLIKMYPDSTAYHESYQLLIQQLDSLDRSIRQKLSNSSRNNFIIYHPALTYYANDYNIKQIPLEQDGKEPSVAYLKQIISQAKNDGIKYVFYQSQFNRSVVESVAKEIGATPVEIDPLSEDVINNLNIITDLIIK